MAITASARRPARRRLINYPRRGKGPVRRWLPSWRVVVGTLLAVIALGAGTLVAAYASTTVPSDLGEISSQQTTVYYSDGTTPIAALPGARRVKVEYKDLPKYVGDAVVASEDSTFWTNSGVDVRGIARAFVNNLKGGARQGGSTLTQQYVERTKTDTNTGYLGKVREAIMALKVTRSTHKTDILQGYLNTIYWGRSTYGIETASQAYFGKSAKDMTYSEAALLAGIIPSPNNWDPGVDKKMAEFRWQRTIDRMYASGFITEKEHKDAKFPTFLPKPAVENVFSGPGGYLAKMAEDELAQTPQFKGSPESIRTSGLKIVTTIDKKDQDAAVAATEEAFNGDHPADPKKLSVGLVSMDPTNGELRAVVGGRDYVKAPFNYVTQGRAQAGSTFKPFTLIAALEDGKQLSDTYPAPARKTFPHQNNGGDWKVTNFSLESWPNPIDLVTATANSVNTVFGQLNIDVGPQRTADVAHTLGMPNAAAGQPGYIAPNPANVLGTASVRPIDLVTAYGTIAGGGQKVTPHIIRDVTKLDGKTLVYKAPTPRTQVVDPDIIKAATYAMTQVVQAPGGSGATARELNRPVAGKTGTTQDAKSAWFAAFVPQLVTVVGISQEENKTQESITPFGQWWKAASMTGSSFPARAWTDYMKVALDGVPVQNFPDYTPPRPSPSPTPSPTDTPTVQAPTDTPSDPTADWVTVPKNLVGQQVNQATGALRGLGLHVSTAPQASDQAKGTVLGVSAAGTRVPPGSTITVTVSTGPSSGNGNGNGNGQPTSPPTDSPTPTPTDSPTDPATGIPTPDPSPSIGLPGKGN
ncbi:MAG: penicillin-binding protein [Promicromonosporaceae bacterium]|nr:penicillin-binding protein [Promicromonosporaceae bacterium]